MSEKASAINLNTTVDEAAAPTTPMQLNSNNRNTSRPNKRNENILVLDSRSFLGEAPEFDAVIG